MTSESAVRRALRILVSLAARSTPQTAADLSRQLDIPHATVARLLQDLGDEGLIRFEDGKAATIGFEALRFAWQIKKAAAFERSARPVLGQLVKEVGETASISRYLPEEGVSAIAMIEYGPRSLSYVLEIGEIKHLNAGATGKSILAFLPADEIEAIIERHGLPAATGQTTVTVERLGRELATIREHGYAISTGERISGAVGIAAPIYTESGEVFGCVGVTTPQHRFASDMEGPFSIAVMRHAEMLSQTMGGGQWP